jgi:hypothetical protein
MLNHNQPGGVWYLPKAKALSYTWTAPQGFSGAMTSTAMAGSLKNALHLNYAPMVRAVPKAPMDAYMTTAVPTAFYDTLSSAGQQ